MRVHLHVWTAAVPRPAANSVYTSVPSNSRYSDTANASCCLTTAQVAASAAPRR